MKINFWLLAATLAFATLARGATNDLTDLLQKGLFEEEANRDLNAAIANYQSLASAFDKDRQLAATAVFRLGECYRKLGKTNDAVVQYQRILKEFGDQPTLVTLSRQNLTGLNVAPVSATAGGNESSLAEAEVASLQTQLQEIEKMNHDQRAIYVQQNFPNPMLTEFMSELNLAQQQLIKLRTDYTPDHPKYKNAEELVNDLKRKADAEVNGVVQSLQTKLAMLQSQVNPLRGRQPEVAENNPLLRLQIQRAQSQIEEDENTLRILLNTYMPENSRVKEQKQKIESEKTALAALTEKLNPLPSAGSGTANGITDEEQQEIRRIQLMIQNSPDLINAPGQGINGNDTPLIEAAMKGQLVVAKYLLDHGADVNGLSGNHGAVPLTAATENGHKAMVELLLSRGADVSGRGLNPFYLAVSKGYLAVAEVLLANKADINAPSGTDGNRMRPVQVAARDGKADVLELLIKHGADVNVTDASGWTPLGLAAANNNTNTVKLLLDAKADIEAKNENGNDSALHEAARRGYTEVVSLLLTSGATVDPTNSEDTTPLLLAVTSNRTNTVRVLLEHKANPNHAGTALSSDGVHNEKSPPVLFAIGWRYNDILKLLLDAGANPKGESPFPVPLFRAVGNRNIDAVQLLLDHGANPNARNREGNSLPSSLLSFAVAANRSEQIVTLLLNKGADPNQRDADGGVPLFHVQTVEVARALIEHKADVNATLPSGITPLMVTPGSTNILTLLLDSGAKTDLQDTNGDTALHYMVRRSWSDAVSVLLKFKANPNIQNNAGDTPLDLARAAGRPPLPPSGLNTLDRNKIVDLLVQAGGLANLPRRDRIEIRRASSSGAALTKGSHDWNRYSLLEMIARGYNLLTQNDSGAWAMNRGSLSALLSDGFRFPDFKNVTIYRRTDASAKQKAININVQEILDSRDRSRDVWLEWGDVVEIPETDHPVDQTWEGLTGQTLTALTNSLAREVTVVIKGVSTPVKLFPKLESDPPPFGYKLWRASFMLRSVLDHSKLVRVSSDLSRVKVTRVDPDTKKKQEWTIDCTNPNEADLWLRNGDVIEVPEK